MFDKKTENTTYLASSASFYVLKGSNQFRLQCIFPFFLSCYIISIFSCTEVWLPNDPIFRFQLVVFYWMKNNFYVYADPWCELQSNNNQISICDRLSIEKSVNSNKRILNKK